MAKAKINPEFTYKTRDGQEVTELQVNDNSYNKYSYPFKAKVGGNFHGYTEQGYFHSSKDIDDMDLIKQPAKKTKPSREVEVSPLNNQAVPHKHHDLIVEWAKDTSKKVQCRGGDGDAWITVTPDWNEDLQYRFKPEEHKLLTIIGADGKARSYPEPCKVKLKECQEYFVPATSYVIDYHDQFTWRNDEYDERFMKGGIHLTKEAAELHAKAMLGID